MARVYGIPRGSLETRFEERKVFIFILLKGDILTKSLQDINVEGLLQHDSLVDEALV